MSYRIAGIDVHKKMLAVVVSDVEIESEYQFERRMSAKAARAAGSVSPSASAFSIRRALRPNRSETRPDNFDMCLFQKRLQLVL
jgi:hypothetical protein